TLTVGEIGTDGFSMALEFARNLFEETTAERMLGHLARLAAAVVESPDAFLSALPMLAPEERLQLLSTWNDTARPIPAAGWAHEQVAAQAALRPEALAVADAESRLSSGDLEARAGRLAGRLSDLGVGPEVPVALFLDRSPLLVVAAYAVLKAGGAYLPLDPGSPPERLAAILAESGAPLVLTRESLRGRLPELPETVQALAIDALDLSSQPPLADPPRLSPESPAYLIYTSGSTGVPNGVEVTHGALRNLLAWHAETFAAAPGERGPLVASPGFDVSVLETWPLLAAGGSVHAPDDATRLAPPALLGWLARERITLGF